MRAAILAILYVFLLPVGGAIAVQPNEVLKDSELEARARNLSKDIRCLVCQNQSIDDSNAGLARDLRVLVRERLSEGDSDEQILDFLVKRYGDFVLLKPPVKASTYALWYGPIVIFVLGVIGLVFFAVTSPFVLALTLPITPIIATKPSSVRILCTIFANIAGLMVFKRSKKAVQIPPPSMFLLFFRDASASLTSVAVILMPTPFHWFNLSEMQLRRCGSLVHQSWP